MNILNGINKKLNTLSILEQDENRREIISAVFKQILKGHSELKKALQDGIIQPADIIKAIKNHRCLALPDQDLGTTYIEQIIGTAIRQITPISEVNRVRVMFGLDKLPPGELKRGHDQRAEAAKAIAAAKSKKKF